MCSKVELALLVSVSTAYKVYSTETDKVSEKKSLLILYKGLFSYLETIKLCPKEEDAEDSKRRRLKIDFCL